MTHSLVVTPKTAEQNLIIRYAVVNLKPKKRIIKDCARGCADTCLYFFSFAITLIMSFNGAASLWEQNFLFYFFLGHDISKTAEPIFTKSSSKIANELRVFFRIWNMGVSTNPWGSLPFPSPLPFPFPLPSLPLSSPFPPEAGGCCAKVGVINPPERVWETPWMSCNRKVKLFVSELFRGLEVRFKNVTFVTFQRSQLDTASWNRAWRQNGFLSLDDTTL